MRIKARLREIPLIELFDQFISDTRSGKRLQPDGSRIGPGTIANYVYTLKLLKAFSNERAFYLRIKLIRYLNRRQLGSEKNYWKKFYRNFTDYLYRHCGHFDNYVGQTIKNIRVFFNYLNKDLVLGVGEFHKHFYVRKEQIPIFPLTPDELAFLINDKVFEENLSRRLRETKDFFVFGCTVALRLSDLLALKKSNIRIINGQQYLMVRSIKTKTVSFIKLPAYASSIISRYTKRKYLLPSFNRSNINKYIKILLEKAGFTYPVQKIRERKGEMIQSKNSCRFLPMLTHYSCAS